MAYITHIVVVCNQLRVSTLGLSSHSAHASKSEISQSLDGIEESLDLRDVYEGIDGHARCQLQALTALWPRPVHHVTSPRCIT